MAEVILLEGAEKDSLAIYFALFEQDPSKAELFSSAFDRAISDIEQFPEIGKIFSGSFRRKLVPRFYEFGVFYVLEDSRTMVHAVLDLRQEPDRILSRLKRGI